MKKIFLFLIFFILTINTATAGKINEVIIFGDSLSDNGNLYDILKMMPKSPPYYLGRFSNGPTWAEHIGNYYYKKNYAEVKNYAYGGATAVFHRPLKDHYVAPVILQEELNAYLLHSTNNSHENTLFILWIGANDYLYETTPDINSVTDRVISKTTDFILSLINKGGRNFLILNLPDLSQTPFAKENKNGDRLHSLSILHNQKLNQAINVLKEQYPGTHFVAIDIFYIMNDMLNHLDQYNAQFHTHVSNVTTACWPGDWWGRSNVTLENELRISLPNKRVSILGRNLDQEDITQLINGSPALAATYFTTQQNSLPCEDADAYLFWDVLHPTAVVHQILGQIVIETLEKEKII